MPDFIIEDETLVNIFTEEGEKINVHSDNENLNIIYAGFPGRKGDPGAGGETSIAAWGNINADGSLGDYQGDFTVSHDADGVYTITLFILPDKMACVATVNSETPFIISSMIVSGIIIIRIFDFGSSFGLADQGFSFIVTGGQVASFDGLPLIDAPDNITMGMNKAYRPSIVDSQCLLSLPGGATLGTRVAVYGYGLGGWKIIQRDGEQIQIAGSQNSTTAGTNGFLESTENDDSVELINIADNTWLAKTFGCSFS